MCGRLLSQVRHDLRLEDYLEFRHVVRNVYTFNLRPDRVAELVRGLRPGFDAARRDLLTFAGFLEELSRADEARDEQAST